MSEIYAALAAVMADCDHVAKRDRNEHQRFLFRGIDAVLNAVGPILRKHQVVVVPDVESVTYDSVSTSTGKPATACRVLVTYRFFASDGSNIATRVAAESWDNGDKAAPKAMSVAFRTALLQALALPTDEPDPDSQTYQRGDDPHPAPPATPPADRPLSVKTRGRLFALMGELGISSDDDQRAFLTDTLGRPVESRRSLTEVEGVAAGKRLRRMQQGDPDAEWQPTFGGEA